MKTSQNYIVELDYILTGTVTKKYGPCGKEGCCCARNEKHWHGPYYIWTRKENGKTITKSLSPTQARFCKHAIRNMQKLKSHIKKWKKESLAVLNK